MDGPPASELKVLVFAASLRAESLNRKLAVLAARAAQRFGATVDLATMRDFDVPLYDGDLERAQGIPLGAQELRRRLLESDAFILASPEYNGSFPGVLKYFIDMLKFPESFERKPVAFTGEAAGIWGALRSIEQLEMIFGYRNAYIYPERVFIPGINQKLDSAGKFADPDIDERLANQAQGFARFVSALTQKETS